MEEIEEKLRVHLDLEQRLPEPSVGRDVQAEEKFDLREDEKMSLEEGDVVGLVPFFFSTAICSLLLEKVVQLFVGLASKMNELALKTISFFL